MWRGFLALVCASGIVAADAQDARAHLGKGNQLIQEERYADAAEEFQKALTGPGLAQARSQLAICEFELRHYERARPLFERMTGSKESGGLAEYYLGRMELIDGNYDSAVRRLQSIPRDKPVRDELYYLGSAYYKQTKYQRAADVLQQAAVENPRDARVHQLLARAYQKLGKGAQAEMEFGETRRLHDYYLEGSVAIGRCRSELAQGRAAEAWGLCGPLIETDDVDKIAAIGLLFGDAGQYRQALAAWEKAAALDADSSEIQYNLALSCFKLNDVGRARAHAAEAVRLRPDFVEANILYGTILYMGAEDREATAVLTHAHELKPDDAGVRKLLAGELVLSAERDAGNGRLKDAVGLLERAAALEPNSPKISARLAELRGRIAENR